MARTDSTNKVDETMGSYMEEGKETSSRSAVLGPYRQSPTHGERVQGHAGVHRDNKYTQWYCNQVGAAC
eukprot:1619936-Prorocentrum_lima.AAC.1